MKKSAHQYQSVTQFIIAIVKPHKTYIALFALIALFWAIANTLLPYTLKIIIDKVVGFQGNKRAIFTVCGFFHAVWFNASLSRTAIKLRK